MAQHRKKRNFRAQILLAIIKAAISGFVPLLISSAYKPLATTPPNCPCQTPQQDNAEVVHKAVDIKPIQ